MRENELTLRELQGIRFKSPRKLRGIKTTNKKQARLYKVFFALIVLAMLIPTLAVSGDSEYTREEYLEKIEDVKALLEASPTDAVLHNRLGYYFYKVGDYIRAKAEYNASIKHDDNYSVPYNNLGIIALSDKKYDEAEGYFNGAIERDPKYAKAVYNLGVTYFKQKRYIKAVRYYLKAKDVDEDYVNEREDLEKGEAELKKALKKDPDNIVLKRLLEKANDRKK